MSIVSQSYGWAPDEPVERGENAATGENAVLAGPEVLL